MDRSLQKALGEGIPTTVVETKDGPEITVKARFISPKEAYDADTMGIVCACAAVCGSALLGYHMWELNPVVGGMFVGGLFGRPYLQMGFRETVAGTAVVKFTGKSIILQGEKGPMEFVRHQRHRFVLFEHPEASLERDRIEIAKAKGKTNWVRYYSDSWVVTLEYMGERYTVAEVMGRHRADAMIARLTLCDEALSDLENSRKFSVSRPEDEWPETTGGL